jgi:hypothetical protein
MRCPSIQNPLYHFRKEWFKVASGTDGLTATITCLRVGMVVSYVHVYRDEETGATVQAPILRTSILYF